jgi:hypothetical protein
MGAGRKSTTLVFPRYRLPMGFKERRANGSASLKGLRHGFFVLLACLSLYSANLCQIPILVLELTHARERQYYHQLDPTGEKREEHRK